ncbi:hypothetical protein HY993_04840, partial [Candidatus Micrarchaeota archaeon]|nr:hypothetical protein [Candidatus Micrarchaeota archaeon]
MKMSLHQNIFVIVLLLFVIYMAAKVLTFRTNPTSALADLEMLVYASSATLGVFMFYVYYMLNQIWEKQDEQPA